jgi:hypothetical protein
MDILAASQWIEECKQPFEIDALHLWYDDGVGIRRAFCLPGTSGQGKQRGEEWRIELQFISRDLEENIFNLDVAAEPSWGKSGLKKGL